MDTVTWQALTVVLTVIGVVGTVWAWRRRGALTGLRVLALTLLPAAAYLTGTLRLFWQIGDAVVSWATRLVLSPTVWLGVALAGTSALLLLGTGLVRRRTRARSTRPARDGTPAAVDRGRDPKRPSAAPAGPPAEDDDMADIEAILKRHGIS